jgi:hypothetical protein
VTDEADRKLLADLAAAFERNEEHVAKQVQKAAAAEVEKEEKS